MYDVIFHFVYVILKQDPLFVALELLTECYLKLRWIHYQANIKRAFHQNPYHEELHDWGFDGMDGMEWGMCVGGVAKLIINRTNPVRRP